MRKPCAHPGCPELVSGQTYCDKHRREKQQVQDRYRGSAHQRGYDARWRRERVLFLQHNPLCVECKRQGRLKPATVVDHVVDHKGNMELFWDVNNWQSLCKRCHDVKTATTHNVFGRP